MELFYTLKTRWINQKGKEKQKKTEFNTHLKEEKPYKPYTTEYGCNVLF